MNHTTKKPTIHVGWIVRDQAGKVSLMTDLEIDSNPAKFERLSKLYTEASQPEQTTFARTYMTDEQARAWAWSQVKDDVGTNGWTGGDHCTYSGFFNMGWNARKQFEKQRVQPEQAPLAGKFVAQIEDGLQAGQIVGSFWASDTANGPLTLRSMKITNSQIDQPKQAPVVTKVVSLPEPVAQQQLMSPDVHDALLYCLWYHLGRSSTIGQPIRLALGIGPYDSLTGEQLIKASRMRAALTTPPQRQPLMEQKYRLLTYGEKIERGDTVLDSDSVTWNSLAGWEVGMHCRVYLTPMRRAIEAADKISARLSK